MVYNRLKRIPERRKGRSLAPGPARGDEVSGYRKTRRMPLRPAGGSSGREQKAESHTETEALPSPRNTIQHKEF